MLALCTYILCYRKKSLATPDCFTTYSVNVESMESCSICLETTFISEEFCMKMCVLVATAEEYRVRMYSKDTLSKIALWRYVDRLRNWTSICKHGDDQPIDP